jgi:hypothetical protein
MDRVAPVRRGLALSLAALAAASAGCGSGHHQSDPLAKAADVTSSVRGARISFISTVTSPALPVPITIRGDGVVAPRGQAAELNFRGGAAGLPGATALSQGQIVMRNLTVYTRVPGIEKRLPHGKRWIKIDLRRFGRAQGINFSQFLESEQDPTQSLRYLRARSGEVRKLGHARVRGVETTRYAATIDLRRFPGTLPAPKRRDARRSVRQLISLTGRSTFPTQVWIDGRGYVRRQRTSLSFRAPNGLRPHVTQLFDFYDFGVRARIVPPPAGQVLDATDVASSAASALR